MNTKSPHWVIRINKKAARIVFYSALVLSILYLFAVKLDGGYPESSKMAEIMVLLGTTRTEINKLIEKNPAGTPISISSLTEVVKIGPYRNMKSKNGDQVYIEYLEVNAKGQITLITSGINAYMRLTPIIEGNTVKEWQCYGRPINVVPGICRNEKL